MRVNIISFRSQIVLFLVVALFASLFVPLAVHAQPSKLQQGFTMAFTGAATLLAVKNIFGGGSNVDSANLQCYPWNPCPCDQKPCKSGCCAGGPRSNTNRCPVGICQNNTSGFVTKGTCVAEGQCLGITGAGAGGNLGGGQQALGLAQQIMQMLQQAGAGGGGGGAPPSTLPAGCTSWRNVTTPNPSDPCAIYNPGVSDQLNVGVGGGGTSNISDSLLNALGGSGTGAAETPAVSTLITGLTGRSTTTAATATSTSGVSPFDASTTANISSSLTGSVKLGSSGATIIANLRQGVSEVAGFFGGATIAAQSQTALSRLCTTRPWAKSGLLGNVMPDTFFDGLCKKAGFQVGTVQPTGGGSVQTFKPTPTNPTPAQPGVNVIQPKVDVWAEPASVRLGTRTYIFWNSQGTVSCTISGPSFSQTGVSGGASTVSITSATTFLAECTAPDGTKVTDSVTVNLAI